MKTLICISYVLISSSLLARSAVAPALIVDQGLQAKLALNKTNLSETSVTNLMLIFKLKNTSEAPIDPKIEASTIVINGKPLKDSPLIFVTGPRDSRWKSLPPGESIEFAYALGKYFRTSGVYKVVWRGKLFETQPIEVKVDPKEPPK